jgi:hypothetical protein
MEHSRKAKQKKVDIGRIMQKNLGPSGSETVNPSYVERLTRQAITGKHPHVGSQPMEISQDGGQPPPGQPGLGGTPIIASVRGGKATGGKQ